MTMPDFSQYQYSSLHTRQDCQIIAIKHPKFDAEIAEKGAQLLSFTPQQDSDWLWLSEQANFDNSSPIRGGIPICFPWFGPHPEQAELGKHGFVRQQRWQLEQLIEGTEGCTLQFSFSHDQFKLQLSLSLADSIQLALNWQHLGDHSQRYSFALHSYFRVDNLSTLTIDGLADQTFLDNTDQLRPKQWPNSKRFTTEVDAVFEQLAGQQRLIDGSKQLDIQASGADSCIVWNPGQDLAATIADIGSAYQQFVCIERGAAFSDSIVLAPGERHEARLSICRAS